MVSSVEAAYNPGDRVRIREDYPHHHHRTPWFIKGKTGVVKTLCGVFPNPETRAYGESGLPRMPLYRIEFDQSDIWQDYQGNAADKLYVDVYQHWLERV